MSKVNFDQKRAAALKAMHEAAAKAKKAAAKAAAAAPVVEAEPLAPAPQFNLGDPVEVTAST